MARLTGFVGVLQIIQVNLTSENPQPIEAGAKLDFTFSVHWSSSPIPFSRRFERYLDYNFFEHQASICSPSRRTPAAVTSGKETETDRDPLLQNDYEAAQSNGPSSLAKQFPTAGLMQHACNNSEGNLCVVFNTSFRCSWGLSGTVCYQPSIHYSPRKPWHAILVGLPTRKLKPRLCGGADPLVLHFQQLHDGHLPDGAGVNDPAAHAAGRLRAIHPGR